MTDRARRPIGLQLNEALHIQMSTEEVLNQDIGHGSSGLLADPEETKCNRPWPNLSFCQLVMFLTPFHYVHAYKLE